MHTRIAVCEEWAGYLLLVIAARDYSGIPDRIIVNLRSLAIARA